MSVLTQYVNASADDWVTGIGASTDADLLVVAKYRDGVSLDSWGWANIDTSSIPDTDEITSAVFHWFDHSYVAERGAGVSRVIWLVTDGQELVYSETTGPTDTWREVTIPAGMLDQISKTGDTKFEFSVNAPANGKDRIWSIRSWDGYEDVNEQCYLVVNHSEASTGRSRTTILR